MDWNDLRYLVAAYRHRTLAGAARELKCEHTTVGRRLAALEGSLGARLFTRTSEGLTPTTATDEIIAIAEEVASKIQMLERRVAGRDHRIEGRVRLTTSETFAAFVIQRLIELRARHPELVVEVLAENRVLDVARGEADIALRFAETAQRDLLVRKLGDVHWSMYASRDYVARRGAPASLEHLAGHDLVAFDDKLAGIPGARWLSEHGKDGTVVFRGSSVRSVLEATLAGMGLSVLPCQVADPEEALERLSPAILGSRTLSLVVHPDLAGVARVRAVMDFLAEIAVRDRALLLG